MYGVGLTPLAFGDDLMILCKADTNSVFLIKSCLEGFFETSGLYVNATKSFVFVADTSQARVCSGSMGTL